MSDDEDNEKWERPSPPDRLFFNQKERDLRKQFADELIERVISEELIYYPIDMENTKFHPLYGEAVDKTFHNPVVVKALIDWENHGELEVNFEENVSFDVNKSVLVHFHKRRLKEDQNLFIQTGDYIRYGEIFYEIAKTFEPRRVFGQIDSTRLEISALCIRARKGKFDAE